MSKRIIKWAILGTSYISEVMASAIQESQTSELYALGSRGMEKGNTFASQFAIPKLYNDYQKLLEDEDIDAVYIGLPNHLHKEWMIRCAQAGKHMLCEKPFVISIKEAHEVISAVEAARVFCMEALMYRCHPFAKKLKELIQNKIIGEVKLYNATYTAHIADIANPTAGGSIRNLGCYPVSLIRLLANAEPVEITGVGRMSQENHTDNQASVILKFPDNSLAVVSTADDIKMCWQFDIYGTQGHLKVLSNPWLPSREDNKILIYLNGTETPQEINIRADKSLYTYQIEAVNAHIIDKNAGDGISLLDSLGNTIVLETWLKQIKAVNHTLALPA
jgi:predicted dehydrogenase